MTGISRNHGTAERVTTDAVAVGFDGSDGSERALRWAADEARYRAAPLLVVLAWEAPPQLAASAGWVPPSAERLEELGAEAGRRLDAALAAAAPALEGLDVRARAVHGPATEVLLDAAREAAVLVVGSRGHGGLVGRLLGSVGQHVAQHASCPVVVVPHDR